LRVLLSIRKTKLPSFARFLYQSILAGISLGKRAISTGNIDGLLFF
jgi:hypothetical protein